jgi:hypothetical protein
MRLRIPNRADWSRALPRSNVVPSPRSTSSNPSNAPPQRWPSRTPTTMSYVVPLIAPEAGLRSLAECGVPCVM